MKTKTFLPKVDENAGAGCMPALVAIMAIFVVLSCLMFMGA